MQLVKPAFEFIPEHVWTDGDIVGRICAEAGYTPDPEQQLVLDALFARRRDGSSAAFETAVICPRQNMKTGVLKMAALGWLFVTGERLIVWSAHEMKTTKDAFRDLVELIEGYEPFRKQLAPDASGGIHRGNADVSIELATGQRIIFKARTSGGGRGLSGDKVILDEGFALKPEHMGSLLPTLSARPDPQIVYGSSAGLADSAILRDIRDRGRVGGGRLGYFEWCIAKEGCASAQCDHAKSAKGCILDDESLWGLANTALGRRITLDYLRAERQALPPEEFARERYGWWDEPLTVAQLFPPGAWGAGLDPDSEILGSPTLAVAMTYDRSRAAIGAAGVNAAGKTHLEPLECHRLQGVWDATRGPGVPGTEGLVLALKRLQDAHGAEVVLDGRGPAAELLPALDEAGVRVIIASTVDVLDATAQLVDMVEAGKHSHLDDPDLNAAVMGAQKRPVGDRFAIGRKLSTFDISPLEAVSLAAWAAKRGRNYDPLDSVL